MSSNVVLPNLNTPGSDQFKCIWYLTRAMKSAGWVYKKSIDGLRGSRNWHGTEGTGNPLKDYWGPGGLVGSGVQYGSQSGTGAYITSVYSLDVDGVWLTIKGLTGFTTDSIGHAITLSGGTKPTNRGTFTIVDISGSPDNGWLVYNPYGVADPGAYYTWSERVSGYGTITWSAIANGREQTISGLSGMTSNSTKHFLNLTGASNSYNNGCFKIIKYIDSSSVVIINRNTSSASAESATGTWTELDPALDIYPALPGPSGLTAVTTGAWIVMQGPSTLKIPISAASSGQFFRGENITQSNSNAQGEIIGYQYDSTSSSGYLVVIPRVIGTGSGALGWSTAPNTITGTSTNATVTAGVLPPVEFVREVVFWRSGTSSEDYTKGSIYYQCLNNTTEYAYRFSNQNPTYNNPYVGVIAAPGGSAEPPNNYFSPIGCFAVKGTKEINTPTGNWLTPASMTATTPSSGTLAGNLGITHIMCANADFYQNVSADGSFTIAAMLQTPSQTGEQYCGFSFQRVDNHEDGDVDPYVWYVPGRNSVTYADYSRTAGSEIYSTYTDHFKLGIYGFHVMGFRRRGFATTNTAGSNNDNFQIFNCGGFDTASSGFLQSTNSYSDDVNSTTATNILQTPVKGMTPVWVFSSQATVVGPGEIAAGPMRKGTLRWAFVSNGCVAGKLINNKTWIQLSGYLNPLVLGPWDGSSSVQIF
jgi:hypothetical protein